MSPLDDFPTVQDCLGVDLKTGSLIVAALGVVHPLMYGCTCFVPISFLLMVMWMLVALYFVASVMLFVGVSMDNMLVCTIWVWYAISFEVLMLMLLIVMALVYTSRKQKHKVFIVILGMVWYILSLYFVVVVNSHRQRLGSLNTVNLSAKVIDKSQS